MSQNYRNLLKDEGFAESRISDLEIAMDALHRALSRLDLENLNRFFSRPIIDRVGDFARAEGGLIDFRQLVDADRYR